MSEVVRINHPCPSCRQPLTAIIERRRQGFGMVSYLMNLVKR